MEPATTGPLITVTGPDSSSEAESDFDNGPSTPTEHSSTADGESIEVLSIEMDGQVSAGESALTLIDQAPATDSIADPPSELEEATQSSDTSETTEPGKVSLRQHPVEHCRTGLVDSSSPRLGPRAVDIEGSDIDTLIHLAAQGSLKGLNQTGNLDIFFLPHISVDPKDRKEDTKILLDDPELCGRLTKALHLDDFFLTHSAWNSNGFLRSEICWNAAGDPVHSLSARFLIKYLQQPNSDQPVPDYAWLFLSFTVLWVKNSGGQVSCILVCYDHCSEIQDKIIGAFNNYPQQQITTTPFAVCDAILRGVIKQYDDALWRFQKPVRDIEKGRQQFAAGVTELHGQTLSNGEGVLGVHVQMHELLRHAIHMNETLEVATKTAKLAMRQVEAYNAPNTAATNVLSGLRGSAGYLANLKLRSEAFVSRIENEIQLGFHIINIYQLQESQRLLRESRDEGKDLTLLLTRLTIFFLPATFVTGFWGMNFVVEDGDHGDGTLITPDVWKFAVSLVVAEVICFAGYSFVRRKGRKPKRPQDNRV
ncbi:hypothetical protein B0I35DRAFT_184974 [Stachybotrys elegans]|uniref:Uncharacterized protein n=1 Tax=Stachybotrys elegans TaxID=80388 RepID=A0A8K0STH0_9HYPO|nr:hypothetical protein B0I35DRAFT_184974 [Stachybotrys elegans]